MQQQSTSRLRIFLQKRPQASGVTVAGLAGQLDFDRVRLSVVFLLFIVALACNLPTVGGGPTPTPLFRTATPPPAATPIPPDAPSPAPTETPLGVFPPTGTPTPTGTSDPRWTPTPTVTPTGPTPTPTPGEPLVIHYVEPREVRRNPSQPNGAIVEVNVAFTGGVAPFTFFDEDQLQPDNPYEVLSSCGAPLVHTARVDSADGQSVSLAYFITVNCPP